DPTSRQPPQKFQPPRSPRRRLGLLDAEEHAHGGDAAQRRVPLARVRELHEALLRWYAGAQRDLPWRRTRDPYAIWLSEIMLQQTRVETATPYYERFLARWPTVHALADAPLDDVLTMWS